MLELNKIYNQECIEGMKLIDDQCIDMILCDLPQGITKNPWDKIIPFAPLWDQYERIIKPNGAIVLFANQPFTSQLVMSNTKLFRYSMVWQKTTSTGFLNAHKMPLRIHEDILVFYKKLPTYHPQKSKGHKPVHSYTKNKSDGANYGKTKIGITGGGSTERFPTSILKYKTDKQTSSLHSTQKPVALLERLIKTYTNGGESILDNCMGSGATAIAAFNTGRNFIGFENDATNYQVANQRILEFKGLFT